MSRIEVIEAADRYPAFRRPKAADQLADIAGVGVVVDDRDVVLAADRHPVVGIRLQEHRLVEDEIAAAGAVPKEIPDPEPRHDAEQEIERAFTELHAVIHCRELGGVQSRGVDQQVGKGLFRLVGDRLDDLDDGLALENAVADVAAQRLDPGHDPPSVDVKVADVDTEVFADPEMSYIDAEDVLEGLEHPDPL